MSDFGEPWTREARQPWPVNRDGQQVPFTRRDKDRAAACVTALAGIPDPAKQVERWKARDVLDMRAYAAVGRTDPLEHIAPAEIAALAAEWRP